MALETYQKNLELGRLYEIKKLGGVFGSECGLYPRIWVNSGSIDIYGSDSATQPTATSLMTLDSSNTNINGYNSLSQGFNRYIAITQNEGTTTEIVSSGLEVIDLGAIT